MNDIIKLTLKLFVSLIPYLSLLALLTKFTVDPLLIGVWLFPVIAVICTILFGFSSLIWIYIPFGLVFVVLSIFSLKYHIKCFKNKDTRIVSIIIVSAIILLTVPYSIFKSINAQIEAKNVKTYTCILGDHPGWVDEILTIDGIQYRNSKNENDVNLYDVKYIIKGKEYKRDELYARTKVDTPCDDNLVYTLKGLDSKKYLVKTARDHTGSYDGMVFEVVIEE